MALILELGRPRQEDHKFEARLDYIECLRVVWTHSKTPSLKKKRNVILTE
jgi:hypothetical protein